IFLPRSAVFSKVKYQTGSEASFSKNVLGTAFRTIGRRILYFFLAAMQWRMRLARPILDLDEHPFLIPAKIDPPGATIHPLNKILLSRLFGRVRTVTVLKLGCIISQRQICPAQKNALRLITPFPRRKPRDLRRRKLIAIAEGIMDTTILRTYSFIADAAMILI